MILPQSHGIEAEVLSIKPAPVWQIFDLYNRSDVTVPCPRAMLPLLSSGWRL